MGELRRGIPPGGKVRSTVSHDLPNSAASIFAAQFASLCRTAYLVVGDASMAEELVMEVFARALPRWEAVERADNPTAYLRRGVVNLSISRLRRLTLERRVARDGGRYHDAWDQGLPEESAVVVEAVRQLPPRQRACVVLRYLEDASEQEVAKTLGCSIGTVKSQLAKARVRLALSIKNVEAR